MKVTQTLKTTLVNSAKEDVKKAQQVLKDAEEVLNWATRLSVGYDFQAPNVTNSYTENKTQYTFDVTKRYFVASRSGTSKGHYITVDAAGNVDCSCPGFQNRARCWATSNPNNYVFNVWMKAAHIFDSNRRLAINN